jgi:DNA-binding CsgD family transcriptional regulator
MSGNRKSIPRRETIMKSQFPTRATTFLSVALVMLGVLLLASDLLPGGGIAVGLPLTIGLLGGVTLLLAYTAPIKYEWAVWICLPGCMLIALGIVLLLNVITGDWKAWAYAWLLLVAGAAIGAVLTGQRFGWKDLYLLISGAVCLLSLILFTLFGAIAGGSFIQVMAPILLIAGGLLLRWTRVGALLASRFPPQTPSAIHHPAPVSSNPLKEPLSEREIEVLSLIGQGLSNAQIAERLTLAQSTVKTHVNNIYSKLDVKTRVQAATRAREANLLPESPFPQKPE